DSELRTKKLTTAPVVEEVSQSCAGTLPFSRAASRELSPTRSRPCPTIHQQTPWYLKVFSCGRCSVAAGRNTRIGCRLRKLSKQNVGKISSFAPINVPLDCLDLHLMLLDSACEPSKFRGASGSHLPLECLAVPLQFFFTLVFPFAYQFIHPPVDLGSPLFEVRCIPH